MNINEQMNQLGQIGTVGYSATDAIVDQLVSRTRRARAIRQGSAAVIGSVGAVGLGVLGAQLFVSLHHQEDPGVRDRNLIENGFAFLNMSWGERYGDDYTGSDQSREDILKAWDNIKASAAARIAEPTRVQPAAPTTPTAPKTTTTTPPAAPPVAPCASEQKTDGGWVWVKSPDTGCVWHKDHQVVTPTIPDGSFLFGNGQVYKCERWHDTATNTDFWGAYSGTGDWGYKMIACDPNDKHYYDYNYLGDSATWNTSSRTCTGAVVNYLGAQHRISCRTKSALWDKYGGWGDNNGDNIKWTLNNDAGKILLDSATYKWFASGHCMADTYAATVPLIRLPQCEQQAACDGGYYRTSDHPTKNGHTYSWSDSQHKWVRDADPAPSPTPTPTDPAPAPTASGGTE